MGAVHIKNKAKQIITIRNEASDTIMKIYLSQ